MNAPDAVAIVEAQGARDMARIRELFLEYRDGLGVDLCFQGFEEEIQNLPGRYARPKGCLLLARDGDAVAGGIGMWPLGQPGVCEMKRLFVREPWQGRGLGRRLALAVIAEARAAGHLRMRLDTLGFMTEARALYRSLGFKKCAPYYHNPLADVLFMEKNLSAMGNDDG